MKREIKFRGKSQRNGEWFFGYLREIFGLKERAFTICPAKLFAGDGFTDLNEVSVDAETIGQGTGLEDREGQEIFEGDILYDETPLRKGIHKNYCVVEWLDDGFVGREFGDPYTKLVGALSEYTHYRIIGNIHDNPELLEP